MPADILAYSRAEHPAPFRDRISLAAVLYGLFAAPIVWAGDLIFDYGLVGHACYPGFMPLHHPTPGLGSVWALALFSHLLALAIVGSGIFVAFRCWRMTGPPSGHSHHMIERGEGRDRYLGIVGIWFSAMFFLIIATETLPLAMVPLCTY